MWVETTGVCFSLRSPVGQRWAGTTPLGFPGHHWDQSHLVLKWSLSRHWCQLSSQPGLWAACTVFFPYMLLTGCLSFLVTWGFIARLMFILTAYCWSSFFDCTGWGRIKREEHRFQISRWQCKPLLGSAACTVCSWGFSYNKEMKHNVTWEGFHSDFFFLQTLRVSRS